MKRKERLSAEHDKKESSRKMNVQKVHYEEFSYKKQGDESKQVFIDLDDAYGIPFSSSAFILTDATKQESKKS